MNAYFARGVGNWDLIKKTPPIPSFEEGLLSKQTNKQMSFIRRDRGSRGGGVAICYNPTKIRMNRFNFKQQAQCTNTELICAVGSCSLTKRKIAAISVYLPPSLQAEHLRNAIQSVTDCIDQVVIKFSDILLFLGGDFNNKSLGDFTSIHPEMKPIGAGATRRGACLDEIYTNLSGRLSEKQVQKPLCKPDGTESDHGVVAASFKLPRAVKSTPTTFNVMAHN